jgi:hypothetical protein
MAGAIGAKLIGATIIWAVVSSAVVWLNPALLFG